MIFDISELFNQLLYLGVIGVISFLIKATMDNTKAINKQTSSIEHIIERQEIDRKQAREMCEEIKTDIHDMKCDNGKDHDHFYSKLNDHDGRIIRLEGKHESD
jgi:hypothetical protein